MYKKQTNLKINWISLKMRVDQKERVEAEKWIERKGLDFYLKAIEAFGSLFPNEEIFEYEEIASYIRHDKSLRDLLYSYLALIEEELRALATNNYEIDEKDTKTKFKWLKDGKRIPLVPRTDYEKITTLSKKFETERITFDQLIILAQQNNILDEFEVENYHNIRTIIRNVTMHHSFILIGDFHGEGIKENVKDVQRGLEAIKHLLPNDSYKNGFQSSLDHLLWTNKPNFTRISFKGVRKHDN